MTPKPVSSGRGRPSTKTSSQQAMKEPSIAEPLSHLIKNQIVIRKSSSLKLGKD